MGAIESSLRVATGRREEQIREKDETSEVLVKNSQTMANTSKGRLAASIMPVFETVVSI